MEQEMTVEELIAFINAQKDDFIIRVKCEEESADGDDKGDRNC